MRLLTTIGKTVSRYTRSPSMECLVPTLLSRPRGIFVPGVTTYSPGLAAGSSAATTPAAINSIAHEYLSRMRAPVSILRYRHTARSGRYRVASARQLSGGHAFKEH